MTLDEWVEVDYVFYEYNNLHLSIILCFFLLCCFINVVVYLLLVDQLHGYTVCC